MGLKWFGVVWCGLGCFHGPVFMCSYPTHLINTEHNTVVKHILGNLVNDILPYLFIQKHR